MAAVQHQLQELEKALAAVQHQLWESDESTTDTAPLSHVKELERQLQEGKEANRLLERHLRRRENALASVQRQLQESKEANEALGCQLERCVEAMDALVPVLDALRKDCGDVIPNRVAQLVADAKCAVPVGSGGRVCELPVGEPGGEKGAQLGSRFVEFGSASCGRLSDPGEAKGQTTPVLRSVAGYVVARLPVEMGEAGALSAMVSGMLAVAVGSLMYKRYELT
ncbi:hypothetical protein DQ04_07221000 [Trypanosoma grayi]|uniref:hypothetical protein n=1 Tax=Trypanosoma grayi TaxID=71804 RepID=UPI0004F45710|nr:hypothetical protein DQ04_07221000 [Trypanosoma grayi]KEG08419.1 hypothetical protein DQ04_07221000 [Trypanosoma grayi]